MRYPALVLCTLLITAVSSYSQPKPAQVAQQTCPIHVDRWFGGSNRDRPDWIKFYYTNTSDKDISAWSTEVEAVDILGNVSLLSPTPVYTAVKHKKPFRAKKKDDEVFPNEPYLPPGSYRVWVYQVKFADGTTWQDDGSHSCHTDHSF